MTEYSRAATVLLWTNLHASKSVPSFTPHTEEERVPVMGRDGEIHTCIMNEWSTF